MEPKVTDNEAIEKPIEIHDTETSSDSDEDNTFGPAPIARKKRVLFNEAVYLQNLPSATMYEKSHKHLDTVLFAIASNLLQCVITASINGDIKLWKKDSPLVFIKKYAAASDITLINTCVSWDESHVGILGHATKSKPETKYFFHIFDVLSFDIISIMYVSEEPLACEFVHDSKAAVPLVAITFKNDPTIAIYSTSESKGKLLREHKTLHEKPVIALKFNVRLNLVISLDESGAIELWNPETLLFPDYLPGAFEADMKSSTDFYELQKNSTYAYSCSFSPQCDLIALLCHDGIIRVFRMLDGKLIRSYDESLDMYANSQNDPKMEQLHLDKFDFGRRFALEKELERSTHRRHQNLVFDESGKILLIPTLVGIKMLNIITNKLVRIIGKTEMERPLSMALLQGKVQKKRIIGSVFNEDGVRQKQEQMFEREPILVVTAYKKSRLYCYTKKEPDMSEDVLRDIIDEVPTKEELQKAAVMISRHASVPSEKPNKITLYTNVGDIIIKLFPESSPRAVDAFINMARTYQFQNYTFYRVIKNFMIQAGVDEKCEVDEIDSWLKKSESNSLKYDRPFTVSLTGSTTEYGKFQFFITTIPAEHLNGEYPIIGRVIHGADVVSYIENRPVDDDDKPTEVISIFSTKLSII